MMYRRSRINHKLLSSLIICGCMVIYFSPESYAEDDGRPVPLKVYIPNVLSIPPSFLKNFATNKLEYDAKGFLVSARGNVEAEQDDTIVVADIIEYDQIKESVQARGNVVVLMPDGSVSFSDKVNLKDGIKDGIIRRFQYEMSENEFFMVAEAEKSDVHARSRGVRPDVAKIDVVDNKKSFF